MAGLAAHDAMSRFQSRQSAAGASGAGELIAVDQRPEHLAFDFDFLVGQPDLLELAREPRDHGTLRRGLAARPALSPPSHARIFPRCAPLEPFTNSQDAGRPNFDCSQFRLAKTLSSFAAVRRMCQYTVTCLALTLHTGRIRRRSHPRAVLVVRKGTPPRWSDVLQVCG